LIKNRTHLIRPWPFPSRAYWRRPAKS